MQDSNFDPGELESLFAPRGEGGDDAAAKKDSQDDKGAGNADEVSALKEQIEKLTASQSAAQEAQHKQSLQMFGQVSALAEKLASREGSSPQLPQAGENMTDEDKRNLFKLAIEHSPDQLSKLMEDDIGKLITEKLSTFKGEIDSEQKQREVSSFLADNVLGKLGDVVNSADSPIIQKAAQIKRMMDPLLTAGIKDKNVRDQIAIAIASGASPEEISKIHTSRAKVEEQARQEVIERLSSMVGTGHTAGETKKAEITETDKEIAAEWGVDLENEEDRKYILREKKAALDSFGAFKALG